MGRKRRLSSFFRSSTGKCKALNRVRTARWLPTFFTRATALCTYAVITALLIKSRSSTGAQTTTTVYAKSKSAIGWAMLRGLRRAGIGSAIVVLFTLCGFAQSPSTSPEQTEGRINSILSHMTLEEKVDLLGGVDD